MNINEIRKDFKILADPAYVYFDNAATSQRPEQVLEAMDAFSRTINANPLRGLYEWSIKATDAYEDARAKTAAFVGADDPSEIVFVRNATEALNLVAFSYGLEFLKEGDEILITVMEHHSNILPWQMVCRKTGAVLKFIEPKEDGTITEEMLKESVTEKTKLIGMGLVSNVLGVRNPVEKAAELVHKNGGVIVVDGAQSAPHMKTDVKAYGADFFSFSGHKMLGPMGIGGLYARHDLLEKMPPFLSGGEMIEYVKRDSATYAEVPHKFEAGTVNASGAVGLAAAIEYLENIGFDAIEEQEKKVTKIVYEGLKSLPHVHVYGNSDPEKHSGIVTFNIDGCHPHDISSVLDTEHIAIRAGHHCAQPLMEFMQERLGMEFRATARASVYFYNTEEEAERFVEAVKKVRGWLGYGA
jgi:cysteine desulfurase/selenocysteine lyase